MADALTPEQQKFIQLCIKGLTDRDLASSAAHKERLKLELKEINVQAEHEYFLTLVNKKLKFSRNENNLLVAVLLGLCDNFDISTPPAYVQGEFPDIDMDYLPEIQKWIKNDWAPKKFGRENVCSITAYGKLGIKSSILDMTKIHGISKDEIQGITTSMEDKDDEGEILKWDKALSMYPAFKAYCEKNPEIASLAQTLISRRKSASMHAGGLIISSVPISDFVPLEVRSVDKDNKYGVIVAAWSEGQATQDLGPVGLVKFDVLVVDGLMQIALTCDLLRKRRGIESVCALPNRRNWSDTSYLDDPASIAMANRADLKCCFQFGSEGIRKLVKKGGVTCFDDIATYSAIFRPGPLGMGMGERFCLRKRGLEEYELHPLLQPILGATYGVMAYQEQVMKILNIVGNIPLIHCEKIRKAISKKKVELFAKYKEMFLVNGQKNLGESLEYVQNLWETIESFADYGFNKSMTIGTEVATVNKLKQIQDFVPGDIVYCVNEQGETVETEVVALHDHGEIEGFEVTFDDGHKVTCSINHKFLTEKGQVSLEDICRLHLYILCDQQDRRSVYANEETRWMEDGLRRNFKEQSRTSRTCKNLRNMQGNKEKRTTREIYSYFSMWNETFNQERFDVSQSLLREMSCFGMEESHRNASGTLWSRIHDVERARETSEDLRKLREDQAREYSQENGDIEYRQSTPRSNQNILGYSSKNIYETRDPNSTSRETHEMEKSESRAICEMHRSCLEKSKTFENGSLVKGTNWVGFRTNSLRRRPKASRFCERQYLDRSRRLLPLLRTSIKYAKSISPSYCSSQGQDVERGMYEAGNYHASEVEYGMFPQFDWNNEERDLGLGSGHAEISDTRNLVHRKIVRVVPVGKCHMFDLEVANPTHNFLLANGVVTSNSHSYAYSYITARQLMLKSHWPLEFYTAVLMCADEVDKLKTIKMDAMNHGIEVFPVHINKSKANFSIVDQDDTGKIYYGFSNLKTVGAEVAAKIESLQPFTSFADFLDRFGTDAKVVKCLIALSVFDEPYDRLTLYKFYEYYKDKFVKRRDCGKRHEEATEKRLEKLKALINSTDVSAELKEKLAVYDNEEVYDQWTALFSTVERTEEYKSKGAIKTRQKSVAEMLHALRKDHESKVKLFESKEKIAEEAPPSIDSFNPQKFNFSEKELEKIAPYLEMITQPDTKMAEKAYYGFQWIHDLEEAPEYSGFTIDKFLGEAELQGNIVGCIEVQVIKCERKDFKSGNGFAYDAVLEDANGKEIVVRFWKDDYDRFQDDLVPGTLMKMRVKPPVGSFPSFNFESPPRHERWKLPKNRADDCRIVVMEKAAPKAKTNVVDLTDEFTLEIL